MAEVGVSQQELAKTLGMSRSLLNAYLNGYQTPPVGLAENGGVKLDHRAAV